MLGTSIIAVGVAIITSFLTHNLTISTDLIASPLNQLKAIAITIEALVCRSTSVAAIWTLQTLPINFILTLITGYCAIHTHRIPKQESIFTDALIVPDVGVLGTVHTLAKHLDLIVMAFELAFVGVGVPLEGLETDTSVVVRGLILLTAVALIIELDLVPITTAFLSIEP